MNVMLTTEEVANVVEVFVDTSVLGRCGPYSGASSAKDRYR